jgi:glucose/arabinose dehydrogenase
MHRLKTIAKTTASIGVATTSSSTSTSQQQPQTNQQAPQHHQQQQQQQQSQQQQSQQQKPSMYNSVFVRQPHELSVRTMCVNVFTTLISVSQTGFVAHITHSKCSFDNNNNHIDQSFQ